MESQATRRKKQDTGRKNWPQFDKSLSFKELPLVAEEWLTFFPVSGRLFPNFDMGRGTEIGFLPPQESAPIRLLRISVKYRQCLFGSNVLPAWMVSKSVNSFHYGHGLGVHQSIWGAGFDMLI